MLKRPKLPGGGWATGLNALSLQGGAGKMEWDVLCMFHPIITSVAVHTDELNWLGCTLSLRGAREKITLRNENGLALIRDIEAVVLEKCPYVQC